MKILAKAVQQITIGYTIIGLAFIVYLTLLNGTLIADFKTLYVYIYMLIRGNVSYMHNRCDFIKILKIIPALKTIKTIKFLLF